MFDVLNDKYIWFEQLITITTILWDLFFYFFLYRFLNIRIFFFSITRFVSRTILLRFVICRTISLFCYEISSLHFWIFWKKWIFVANIRFLEQNRQIDRLFSDFCVIYEVVNVKIKNSNLTMFHFRSQFEHSIELFRLNNFVNFSTSNFVVADDMHRRKDLYEIWYENISYLDDFLRNDSWCANAKIDWVDFVCKTS